MAARQVDIGLKVPREQRSYARRSSFSECLRVDRFRANSPHEMSSTVEMAQDHLEAWPDRLSPGKSDNRTSLTMSALSNTFWVDFSIHLKEFLSFASWVVFLLGLDDCGSLVI